MNETLKHCNEKLKPVFEKLKKDKKALSIIAIGLFGMMLIMFSGTGEEADSPQKIMSTVNSDISQQNIKTQVAELIENISGAGKTQVMITYESAEETVYATDIDEQNNGSDIKIKKEHIIVENDSEEAGLTVKVIYPKVQGVAVICEGGDDPIVKEKIYSLISALFDINSNNISVASMA